MTTAITRAANVPATPIRPVPERLTTTNTAPAGTDVPIRPTPTRPTTDAAGPKSVAAYRDLLHDFRDGLREAFHAAGKGREFEHERLLAGVDDAVAGLHTGLQALHDLVEENQPVPDPTSPYALQDVPQPGGLVSSEG